jgi:hypothetical protein
LSQEYRWQAIDVTADLTKPKSRALLLTKKPRMDNEAKNTDAKIPDLKYLNNSTLYPLPLACLLRQDLGRR